ncbi:MAG: fimbrial protein, partial [Flavobacterium psychrophilum]
DPSILKTVSVTFKGTTDDELTDMLTLDTSSSAKGIAIGLELNDGVLLAVNKSSPATQLVSGKNSLTFGAYVKAKPTMVASKSLSPGDFTANSTFLLSYQ